jgi:hypothetical protein
MAVFETNGTVLNVSVDQPGIRYTEQEAHKCNHLRSTIMAKGQQRKTKEAKKPKKETPPTKPTST